MMKVMGRVWRGSDVLCFEELVDLLDEWSLEYTITGGTLLGCIRHGCLMGWDDDIDILMCEESLRRFGILLRHRFGGGGRGELGSGFYRSRFGWSGLVYRWMQPYQVDIWPYTYLPRGILKTVYGGLEVSRYFPNRLFWMHGRWVRVPYDPEWLLDIAYGEDWRTRIVRRLDGCHERSRVVSVPYTGGLARVVEFGVI